MVPPNETGSISEPVFFALRYNYLFRPYSTILSGRLQNGWSRKMICLFCKNFSVLK